MRVCFVGNFTAGGTESATFLLANKLSQFFEVFLVNISEQTPFFYLNNRIQMEYLNSGNIFKRIIKLSKYLKQNDIDVVIAVEAMTGIYSIPSSIVSRCKNVIWEHANYFQNQGTKHINKVRQLELSMVDDYVVLTKRDLANFKNNFNIKCNIEYIYNTVERIEDICYNIDSKIIVSAGHIRDIKNFIIIPDIGKIVFKKHPDWVWKIYGECTGSYFESVRKKVNEYGLENNIIFMGRTNEMGKVYREASMHVMTSKMEGLPMVLLEAKAYGLPLISFDIETGPDEIIDNNLNGFLIEPYNIDEMAKKICELIENRDLRQKFSYNAHIGIEKFEVNSIINKWIKIIER